MNSIPNSLPKPELFSTPSKEKNAHSTSLFKGLLRSKIESLDISSTPIRSFTSTPMSSFEQNSSMGSVTEPFTSPFVRERAHVEQLEQSLSSIFEAEEMRPHIEQSDTLKEAIGVVSFAIQWERSGKTSNFELKDHWLKAQKKLDRVFQDYPEIASFKEATYHLNLMRLHVSRHLNEIATLIDQNSSKPPLYFDNLEKENFKLKKEISFLKMTIEDLNAEIIVLQKTCNLPSTAGPVTFIQTHSPHPMKKEIPEQVPPLLNESVLDEENDPVIQRFELMQDCVNDVKNSDAEFLFKYFNYDINEKADEPLNVTKESSSQNPNSTRNLQKNQNEIHQNENQNQKETLDENQNQKETLDENQNQKETLDTNQNQKETLDKNQNQKETLDKNQNQKETLDKNQNQKETLDTNHSQSLNPPQIANQNRNSNQEKRDEENEQLRPFSLNQIDDNHNNKFM